MDYVTIYFRLLLCNMKYVKHVQVLMLVDIRYMKFAKELKWK